MISLSELYFFTKRFLFTKKVSVYISLSGDNLRGEQMAGGAASGEGENGWSAILNSNPEIKAVVSACEKYIPFLLIILVKSVFEHGTGIIVCCGLVLTFLHANSVLKQQVSLTQIEIPIYINI